MQSGVLFQIEENHDSRFETLFQFISQLDQIILAKKRGRNNINSSSSTEEDVVVVKEDIKVESNCDSLKVVVGANNKINERVEKAINESKGMTSISIYSSYTRTLVFLY